MTTTRVPALGAEGWFDPDDPALLGSRCTTCATIAFPPVSSACPNPACRGTEHEPTRLSTHGRVWAATDARYEPPAPFVAPGDEYVSFAIAAVELPDEGLVVLGQVAGGTGAEELPAGTEMELVVDTLFADDEHEYLVWKWQKAASANGAGA